MILIALALTLALQPAPDGDEAAERLRPLAEQWALCVRGRVDAEVASRTEAARVVTAAIAACADDERTMHQAWVNEFGAESAGQVMPDLRDVQREEATAYLERARAARRR